MFKNERFLTSILVGLVVLHLVVAGLFSAVNPLAEAPDEADHWAYVVYLAKERRLPIGPKVTQSKHPPFYHATAALVADLLGDPSFEFLRANPDIRIPPPPRGPFNFFIHTAQEKWPWRDGPLAFHIARLWSVFLSTGTLLAAYGIARNAFPALPGLALFTVGVLAFLPTFAFIGGAVSNDGTTAFFGATALWGGFRLYRCRKWQAGWWTSVALGLGVLTKVSVVAIWLPVALLVIAAGTPHQGVSSSGYGGYNRLRRWHQSILLLVKVFFPALLIASPWFIRNWLLYGDPLGLSLTRQTIDLRLTPWTWEDTWWLLKGWFLSFWGRFGAIGQIAQPRWMDWLLLVLSTASGLGLIRIVVRKNERTPLFSIGVLSLAVVSVMAVIWRYSLIALGTDQGRLLYPGLAPLMLLWSLGLWAWVPSSWRLTGGIGAIVATAIWCSFIWFGVIAPAYSPTPIIVTEAPPASAPPLDFEEIRLVSYQLEPTPTLYWTASRFPTQDWRTVVRITAEDGSFVWEWRRSPGEGRWATDRWSPGVIIRDPYTVDWPEWAGPGRYRLELGVQVYEGPWAIPVQAGNPVATAEHPLVTLGWIERIQP